jgi:hypothetical protein
MILENIRAAIAQQCKRVSDIRHISPTSHSSGAKRAAESAARSLHPGGRKSPLLLHFVRA